jgi:hypothetical protein
MAKQTKCPICDEAVWGFDLTAHLFSHLPHCQPSGGGSWASYAGQRCWCGKVFHACLPWWNRHLQENGGWKVHYAKCVLGINTNT